MRFLPRPFVVVLQFFLGILLFVIGGFGSYVVANFIGRGHHDQPLDLHLEWVLQPNLPYWSAHVGNLLCLLMFILLFLSGCLILCLLGRNVLRKTRRG